MRVYHSKTMVLTALVMAAVSPAPAVAAQNKGPVAYESAASPEASRALLKTLLAAVKRDASLVRGVGAVKSARGEGPTGRYLVTFNRDVSSCYYLATLGIATNSGGEAPGSITTVRKFDKPRVVLVATSAPDGAAADRAFFLHVECP